MRNPWLARILSWLSVAIVGAVFGVAATIAHSATWWGFFPIGMILGAIACAAILIAIRVLTADRWAGVAAGIGMVVLVTIISGRGPGGSVIVPNTLSGQIWGFLIAGIVIVIAVWPDFSKLRVRSES